MRTPPRVLPALITPFDGRGELDVRAHVTNLELLATRGIEGFLMGGSTGEGPYLEPGERRRLLDTARDTLGQDPVLMCGIAAETRRVAVAQLDEAAAGGADAALVMTPTTLVRGDDRAVHDHYSDLAESAPLPIMIYSVPPYTAYEPPVWAVADLAAHPNVVGMKDSGGDPVRIGRIAEEVPAGFHLYNGSSASVHTAIASGAFGAITASANYAPDLVTRLVEAALRNGEEARKLQSELSRLKDVVESHRIPGVKAAANVVGLSAGNVRAPLLPLADDVVAAISAALAAD